MTEDTISSKIKKLVESKLIDKISVLSENQENYKEELRKDILPEVKTRRKNEVKESLGRRSFLKMLGISAGTLALTTTGASQWIKLGESSGETESVSNLQSISAGTHTNDTGHPIKVYVKSNSPRLVNGGTAVYGAVNGTEIVRNTDRGYAGANDVEVGPVSISFIVPSGADYTIGGSIDTSYYQELRF